MTDLDRFRNLGPRCLGKNFLCLMRKTITLHVRDCTFFGSLSSLHYYGEISLDIDPQSRRHLAIV